MKKILFLTTFLALVAIGSSFLLAKGWLLAVAAWIAITSIGFIYYRKSDILQLTRWAKAHPTHSQVLIAGLLFGLMGLGLITGHTFHQMGYDVPSTVVYIFSVLTMLGFFYAPFLPQKRIVAIPRLVNRLRTVYWGISFCTFVLMIGLGNRAGIDHPGSVLDQSIQWADQQLFPIEELKEQDLPETQLTAPLFSRAVYQEASGLAVIPVGQISGSAPGSSEVSHAPLNKKQVRKAKKANRKMKRKMLRTLLGAGSCALAVLLIILLVATTCAGICLVVLGINAAVNGSVAGGVAAALLGPLVVWGSIAGIIRVGRWCKGDGDGGAKKNND